MAKIPVQVIADPTASTWLSLSASDGADGLSLSLDHDIPIDVQLTRLVAERQNLRNSFGLSGSAPMPSSAAGNRSASNESASNDIAGHISAAAAVGHLGAGIVPSASNLPPPATLGVIAFSRTPASSDMLRKLNYKNAVPKTRSLGLDSLLLFSSTLLPGVDKTASTSGSSDELVAYLNASGLEPSPWQLIHAGCTPGDYAAVSGYNSTMTTNNLSFAGGNGAGAVEETAQKAAADAEAATEEDDQKKKEKKSSSGGEEDEKNGEKKKEEQEDDGDDGTPASRTGEEDPERKKPEDDKSSSAPASARSLAAPPTPGRITLILVGDLLSYCHGNIFSMVASMARPFRSVPPRVIEPSLLAYCAQESLIVAGGLRVSRDGCSVWRPRGDGAASKRHSSMIHKSSNLAMEASLPVPSYENGCAIFVNHPIGPASHVQQADATSGALVGGGAVAFRRVLRITWTDAFHGAEHGGPEGRKRFSAPCVAVGVLHSSQALQALRQAEHSHVFGKMRDSVMWCMSPDAALFPGPHLSAVRGPSFQAQPHLYVPNPLLANQIRTTSSSGGGGSSPALLQQQQQTIPSTSNSNIIAASVSGSRSRSDFAAALSGHRQSTHGAAAPHNPTVISTTVTILCDPSMQAVTFLNNGRRVASWDLSTIWAMKQREAESANGGGGGGGFDGNNRQPTDSSSHLAADGGSTGPAGSPQEQVHLASVFYPVIDIGSSGTIVEVIC